MRTGFYAGSFDPVTNGHLDIVKRAAGLVDRLVVAIGAHHGKAAFMTPEERVGLLEDEIAGTDTANGCEIRVTTFADLVVDAARRAKASVLIRGLRNGTDFDYERQLAGMNAAMAPEIETIFLAAAPQTSYVSSSLVKQIAQLGGDIRAFVPPRVAKAMSAKIGQ